MTGWSSLYKSSCIQGSVRFGVMLTCCWDEQALQHQNTESLGKHLLSSLWILIGKCFTVFLTALHNFVLTKKKTHTKLTRHNKVVESVILLREMAPSTETQTAVTENQQKHYWTQNWSEISWRCSSVKPQQWGLKGPAQLWYAKTCVFTSLVR